MELIELKHAQEGTVYFTYIKGRGRDFSFGPAKGQEWIPSVEVAHQISARLILGATSGEINGWSFKVDKVSTNG